MLRGMCTFNLTADDPVAAADWYAVILGEPPYFRRDDDAGQAAYVEFRIGDSSHELGILRRAYAPWGGVTGGTIAYWAVDDVRAAFDALLAAGATAHEPPIERGPGYVTASVVDPFGNLLGVMENSHYEQQITARAAG